MAETAPEETTALEMVTIKVGKKADSTSYSFRDAMERKYRVPIRQICEASDYFKKALLGGFKESKEKEFTCDDVSAAAFEVFLLWMNSAGVVAAQRPTGSRQKRKMFDETDAYDEIISLIEVCQFAGFICCNELHNAAIERMFDIGEEVCPINGLHKLVPDIYDATVKGHPLRKMLALLIAKAAIALHNTDKVTDVELSTDDYLDDFWVAMRVLGLPCQWPLGPDLIGFAILPTCWKMKLP